MPFIAGGVGGLLLFAFWIFAIFDVISTDSVICRNLPKPMWVIMVILLPAVGSIAWFLLGRPLNTSFGIGSQTHRAPTTFTRAPLGIEDRPDWPAQSRKLLADASADAPQEASQPPAKDEIRQAADERSRRLQEWEARLLKREKELDDRRRQDEDPDTDPS